MTEKEAVNVADILKTVRGAPAALAGIPGSLGGFALNTARRGANVLGDIGVSLTRPGINPGFSPGVNKALWNASEAVKGLGTKTIGAAQKGVERMTGMAHTSKFNPLNVATGAGILGGGAAALSGKGQKPATSAAAPKAPTSPLASGLSGISQRGMDMWKSLPVEARYAIGAGVPLALLGGFMGRKGGLGGLGLGALGLGAAALGGASGGMFGEGARRFSGKMLYNIGSFFGGKGDTASQINQLSRLSPELGATVLMGRDPKLSAQEALQQYHFVTKNKDMIARMMPNLDAKKASASDLYAAVEKTAFPLTPEQIGGTIRSTLSHGVSGGMGYAMQQAAAPKPSMFGAAATALQNAPQSITSTLTPAAQSLGSSIGRTVGGFVGNAQMPMVGKMIGSQMGGNVGQSIGTNLAQGVGNAVGAVANPMSQMLSKAAVETAHKMARCWKGYEPVPGKAPYSEDSCRPVGSKKKKKEEKKAGSSVFKLTEKKPEAVVDGKKPTSEGHEEKVTRAEPARSEDLRPEEVQPSKSS